MVANLNWLTHLNAGTTPIWLLLSIARWPTTEVQLPAGDQVHANCLASTPTRLTYRCSPSHLHIAILLYDFYNLYEQTITLHDTARSRLPL